MSDLHGQLDVALRRAYAAARRSPERYHGHAALVIGSLLICNAVGEFDPIVRLRTAQIAGGTPPELRFDGVPSAGTDATIILALSACQDIADGSPDNPFVDLLLEAVHHLALCLHGRDLATLSAVAQIIVGASDIDLDVFDTELASARPN